MRLFIIYLIIGQPLLSSAGFGPSHPPTKGEVWPAPQKEYKSDLVYLYRSSDLKVTVPKKTCGILTTALERYNLVLRDLELFQNLNHEIEYGQAKRRYRNESLKELRIELSSECEEAPHYRMDEKYRLKVSSISVLESDSIWGILRGLETFVQLFYFPDDFSNILINATTIVDYPQYKHRGLLIDTSRHYLSLSTIYKTLDAMAMNKMNVLHWHIVDDQSFPYQSERFPTLSEKGAYYPTMVYTKNDIRSVVAFARDRGIRVVPEIDVPGHVRSWGNAMPNILTECYSHGKPADLGPLDPTKPLTYKVLRELFLEVHQWFTDEFIHIGGDEVATNCWASNPHIKEYLKANKITVRQLQGHFMKNTLPLLPKLSKPIVWQEAFDMGALPNPKTHVQVWKYKWITEMIKILEAGHYVIFSSAWYLDEYLHTSWQDFYRADPRQMVYNETNSTTGLNNIVGGEACMWGEMVDDSNMHSVVWPRASAIAERLWTGLNHTDFLDPVTEVTHRRIEEHTCRMNRRGVPARPPSGPGFCVGAPPPLQKIYEVHLV